jgi:hypothetical protein
MNEAQVRKDSSLRYYPRPVGHHMTVEEFIVGIAPHLFTNEDGRPRLGENMPGWPPDVFAMVAFLLQQTGAYLRVSYRWPPRWEELGAVEACGNVTPVGGEIRVKLWRKYLRAVGKAWKKCWIERHRGGTELHSGLWDPQFLPQPVTTWWKTIGAVGKKTPIDLLALEWREGGERSLLRRSEEVKKQVCEQMTTSSGEKISDLATAAEIKDLATRLICLMAVADEACEGLGVEIEGRLDVFQRHAFRLLGPGTDMRQSSLCQAIHPSKMRVLPKLRTPQQGLTLRSLSFHLSFYRGPVNPIWHRAPLRSEPRPIARQSLNLLVVHWPYEIFPRQFDAVKEDFQRRLPAHAEHFHYRPRAIDEAMIDDIRRMYEVARERIGTIHGVIMPEMALNEAEFDTLANYFINNNAGLVAGTVSATDHGGVLNRVSCAFPFTGPHYRVNVHQSKHHRWCLDAHQIANYGIASRLAGTSDEARAGAGWWEGIELPPRELVFFPVENWFTFATLVCEDLARQDPVAELVRAVGPHLLIALLMDGPQLKSRWASRYATVLAEDPGSSVLSLTALGMADLSRPLGALAPSRVVALWKEAGEDPVEIALPKGKQAAVLCLAATKATERTTDGRINHDTISLRLGGIHYLGVEDGLNHDAAKDDAWRNPPILQADEAWVLAFMATLRYGDIPDDAQDMEEETYKRLAGLLREDFWDRLESQAAQDIASGILSFPAGAQKPEKDKPSWAHAVWQLRQWVKSSKVKR